eukprot:CAMPEP_0114137128 /NCGR_PEP_ID=MMETSP0043_2-20121206/15612_1 /TAXON_ID=464988 /ORGANISM="Hemiselmis andersenii, Strain CCMP644" /LENGTH=67 /DNA_ID=CAMNT_0001230987 /DNA_START=176 /DNA_END=375 /DNA_ORIENTATION=-
MLAVPGLDPGFEPGGVPILPPLGARVAPTLPLGARVAPPVLLGTRATPPAGALPLTCGRGASPPPAA